MTKAIFATIIIHGLIHSVGFLKAFQAEAEQWFKTEEPGFIWVAKVKFAPGIHLAARDKYEDGRGQMIIKLLSLIPVSRAEGKEIDQGAMVRY
jgi:hypothetical protein